MPRLLLMALTFAAATAVANAQAPTPPEFHRDVAPILIKHCGSCHRPAGIAPFSLLDYRDVVPRSRQLVDAVQRGTMPPWLPERGGVRFSNERGLSPVEVETLTRWVSAGALEGTGSRATLPPAQEWRLGTPDLVVAVPQPFVLPAGSTDAFRNFAAPIPVDEARWVRGIEVDPGNARVVHHASVSIDRTRASRRLDESDPLPGFSGGMFAETAQSPDSRALGWTPGLTPLFEPDGMAWRLPRGADLVIQLHMIPDATAATTVQPRVAFYFSSAAPTRVSIDIRLGSRDIDIPAGESNFAIADAFTLPVDAQVTSVYPHAHYLAREMYAEATLPDGRVQPLLSIPHWDFHWQEEYRYAEPVMLPRGSVVRMRYTYDNSDANRRRAAGAAPGRVVYGPLSSDEMGDLWLRLTSVVPGEAAAIARGYLEHEREKTLALNQKRVAAEPQSAVWRNALGASYLDAGRVAEGVVALEEAIRLQPTLAEAHHNLAQAWRRSGRPREAIREARQAVDLGPGSDVAWLNFGNVLLDNGDLDEAVAALSRALTLNPSLAEAHNNIGIALGALQRYDEAEARFLEALEIQPDYEDAVKNLAVLRELKRD